MSAKKQNEKIAQEIEELTGILSNISDEKKRVAKSLIERAAFMKITLELLEDRIKKQGATYKFEQGSQKMWVENPAQKSYNTMVNRYANVIDKLNNLLPEDNPNEVDDGFDDFMKKRDDD